MFTGKETPKHLKHCIEHSLLTERELKVSKETMLLYVETVSLSLIDCFPEMDFIIDNTSFLDPSLRQLHRANIPALVERFNTDTDPCDFDVSVISTQYTMYQNDSFLDFYYEPCQKNHVTFWCELYESDDYKDLVKWAILLLSVSPLSVICECGFSSMNYIKNEYSARLCKREYPLHNGLQNE